jgi:hypothetical protein
MEILATYLDTVVDTLALLGVSISVHDMLIVLVQPPVRPAIACSTELNIY